MAALGRHLSKDDVVRLDGSRHMPTAALVLQTAPARQGEDRMARYVGAIDQGTTSSRFIVFDRRGAIKAIAQREHEQIFPKPGWVEHNPNEIWHNTKLVMRDALRQADIEPKDLAAIGITNQRETTLIWDRTTGKPLHNALVWQDTRTDKMVAAFAKAGGRDRFRALTGLPLASYFAGLKLKWLLDNVKGARRLARAGDALFGTIDTWLAWNLTGGIDGGCHVTDVTNASRTQLMNLKTLSWDDDMLRAFEIPRKMLPAIRPSSGMLGACRDPIRDVPIAGILGDQQAALFGQACFNPGEAKNTYGTGSFVLMNSGAKPVRSTAGLITTVAYQIGDAKPVYALEGSIAITGALVQWLRDNLGLIEQSADVEALARTVETNGDVYFVPAFSGLYAPHWQERARGVLVGLTRYATKGHIARAALEAAAYQTRDVLIAMKRDSKIPIAELRCDGGMAANDLLMQFQADILDVTVVRPRITETTALGAAYAAGLAVGYWTSTDELVDNWEIDRRWHPQMSAKTRRALVASWNKALARSFDWKDAE